MKNKIIKSFAVISLLLFSTVAFCAGWSGKATVEEMYALSETHVIFKLSSFSNPDNCQVNSAGHVILNPTTQKTWLTMLLTAYAAQKTVNIYVRSSCTPIWANTSYADIHHVKLL